MACQLGFDEFDRAIGFKGGAAATSLLLVTAYSLKATGAWGRLCLARSMQPVPNKTAGGKQPNSDSRPKVECPVKFSRLKFRRFP